MLSVGLKSSHCSLLAPRIFTYEDIPGRRMANADPNDEDGANSPLNLPEAQVRLGKME